MIEDLIHELEEKDIKVNFINGKLIYRGPQEFLNNEMLAKLEASKRKLLKQFWPRDCWNIMPINTEGSLTPTIILHAGPTNYPLSEKLGSNRPYFGYFYIGSEGEKIRYKNLEAFAAEYLKQLEFVCPNGPYYLGGLSFGGHLAYEMAIQLQKKGKKVPLLFLIDAGLPKGDYKVFGFKPHKRIYNGIKKIYYYFYDLFWKLIFGYLSSFKENIPVAKRNRFIRWTYKEYIKKYQPKDQFQGKAVIFKADQNTSQLKYLGWDAFCPDIELVNFVGDHGAMYNNESSVTTIINHINNSISEFEKVEVKHIEMV